MSAIHCVLACVVLCSQVEETPKVTAADIAGAWQGTLEHPGLPGETTTVAFEFEPDDVDGVAIYLTAPVAHMHHGALGIAPLRVAPTLPHPTIHLGPFAFSYDAAARTLTGAMPADLVPRHRMNVTLHAVERLASPGARDTEAPRAEPVWDVDLHAPQWPGVVVAAGRVFSGGDDGVLHALDASNGDVLWTFRAGGPIRCRPTLAANALFFQADDGFAYRIDVTTGREAWRVRVNDAPIVRLPLEDPRSRFDSFASGVVVAGARAFLGTHEGQLLALDAESGARAWSYDAGASILGAPAVAKDRLWCGAFDGRLHAVATRDGAPLWTRDLGGAITTSPARAGTRLVLGTRAYDLFGIDADTGDVEWSAYSWFSWIESTAAIDDGVAYVGSSDGAVACALDAESGKRLWSADALGWTWGTPAVTADRVYVGSAGRPGYFVPHRARISALDRKTGELVWRHDLEPSGNGAFGCPGTLDLDGERVYASALDGHIRAFRR